MKKIASFTIDHTKLTAGIYISRIDGDVITYDLRMKKPNSEQVMTTGSIHAQEHLGATFLRNSAYQEQILYFGPMGCRTGFYLLTRNIIPQQELLVLLQQTFQFIADFVGEIPGASAVECGNYQDMDLSLAQIDAKNYLVILQTIINPTFAYPQ